MAKFRKAATKRSEQNSSSSSPSDTPNQKPLVEIPEAEQWKIIKESGILKTIPVNKEPKNSKEEEPIFSPRAEEMFGAIALIIPHCFLLLMMEILVHYQYGRKPTWGAILERMIPGIPILSIFIFYTSRYKFTRAMQAFFFFLSLGTGGRLVYIINKASWLVNLRQAPPLATAWVYAVVQLNLLPASLSLALVYSWLRYMGLKIFF